MTPVQQQTYKPKDLSVSLGLASNILITNLSCADKTQEYSHAFSTGTRYFMLRARGSEELRIAFVSTETGTKYITLKPHNVFDLNDLSLSGKIVYIKSDTDNTTVEIIETY